MAQARTAGSGVARLAQRRSSLMGAIARLNLGLSREVVLSDDEVRTLYDAIVDTLRDAVERSAGLAAKDLKGEKKTGLRVHARTGEPCPVCGDTIREVSFADSAFQYCPTCQTGGKPLADRRLSRLLK